MRDSDLESISDAYDIGASLRDEILQNGIGPTELLYIHAVIRDYPASGQSAFFWGLMGVCGECSAEMLFNG